jgi:hypothetical protein
MADVVAINIGNDNNRSLVSALVIGTTVRTETGAHHAAVNVDGNSRSVLVLVLVVDGEDAIGAVALQGPVELDDADNDEDHDHRGKEENMAELHLVYHRLLVTIPHPAATGALRTVFEECLKGT